MKAITELLSRLGALPRHLALAVLAVASWWGVEHFGPSRERPTQLTPGKVDYYSKGLRRMVLDDAGKPKELLIVDELVHYENDNRSELANPVMTLYVAKGPPWVIHAESATVPGQGDEINLHGDVLVTRDADERGRTMRIETSNARVQPNRKYAETDEDITVLSPPDSMTGTGAQFSFGDNLHYQVMSNVRRTHEVQKR